MIYNMNYGKMHTDIWSEVAATTTTTHKNTHTKKKKKSKKRQTIIDIRHIKRNVKKEMECLNEHTRTH